MFRKMRQKRRNVEKRGGYWCVRIVGRRKANGGMASRPWTRGNFPLTDRSEKRAKESSVK